MVKKLSLIVLLLSFCSESLSLHKSQPLFINGRYYSDKDDLKNNHFRHAFVVMAKKMLSPSEWKKRITSLIFSTGNNESHSILDPQQIKPYQQSIEPQFIWIGHATFLIQINGFNILTDPIFGNVKVGRITLTKRVMKPGIKIEDLPPIDVILISHNHPDHVDYDSLCMLSKKFDPVILVPHGDKKLFEGMGFSSVIEHGWYSTTQLDKDSYSLEFFFLPARHWSLHFFSLNNYRKSLWGSWMIQSNHHSFYFAGDSAYGDHFKEIAQYFPSIDIAFLPIAPTSDGDNKHKHCHVNAKEAVDAFIDLNSQYFVPMHYGTFFLGKETLENPLQQLNDFWNKHQEELQNKVLLWAQCGREYKMTFV